MKARHLCVCLFAAAMMCLAHPAHAQGTLSTILSNGPTANRINLVLLAEGYTAGELPRFLLHATNAVNSLLAAAPYSFYRNHFNAFAVSVASAESGSDHYTPTRQLVDTYFNSSFDSYKVQRLLTIPPNDHDHRYADGEGKVIALLEALLPEYDLVFLLVNDPQYGGSGGNILVCSVNSAVSEIARHESGHSMAVLADEYSDAYPGYTPVESPNATMETNRLLVKWSGWIADATPIPTPAVSPYVDYVGLFEGAQYQATGWYRPRFDCRMNHLGVEFCEVCSQEIIKSIYQRLPVIESFEPAQTNTAAAPSEPLAFRVQLLQPAAHTMGIQWFSNGVPVLWATNDSFVLNPGPARSESVSVRVDVWDPTPLVRNDPTSNLNRSVTWTLGSPAAGITDLTLSAPQVVAGGRFSFLVTGKAPNGFVIENSTNLLTWAAISTNALETGSFRFTNAEPIHSGSSYYRALGAAH